MKLNRSQLVAVYSITLALGLVASCSTPKQTKPTQYPPPPPVVQTWTNALRPPSGHTTPGIVIYLPQPPDSVLAAKLAAAGAVKRSATAYTLEKLDLNSMAQIELLKAVGYAGGHTTPYVFRP